MKNLKKLIALLIIVIIFYFMGKALYQNWRQIPFGGLKFNPLFLIYSYFSMVITLILMALGWKLCLECFKVKVGLWKANQILSIARLGIYVPGKIWAMAGLVYLAKQEGIPGRKTGANAIMETLLTVLSALLISTFSFSFFMEKVAPVKNIYLLFIVIALCFIALYPPLFTKVANWGLRIIKQEPVEFKLHYTRLLVILSVYLLNWFFQGLCFYFLIASFYPIPFDLLPVLLSLHVISWIVGFLSIITPGGLGVRDGLLSYLLKFYLPVSIGITAALLFRLWGIIGMISFAGIFGRGLIRTKRTF
ncbi:MAG: flippase-like domain-containing protein [Candidatus Stahlbacteria bacterium]|nr:flippase-like domain-containing protein [Candidatus Stahlbacteria bacterium]